MDSDATFLISHIHDIMSGYKKTSPGTNVEIADGNIVPVDEFGRTGVDLKQPGYTTGMARIDVLFTLKVVKQWVKPLVYYKTKALLRFPGNDLLVFNFCPRKGLFLATYVRRIPS